MSKETTTTTDRLVTETEEQTAADIDALAKGALTTAEGLRSIAVEVAYQLRALDRDIEPRRTLTVDSDFMEEFDGTQYLTAHSRVDELTETLMHAVETVREVLAGDHDTLEDSLAAANRLMAECDQKATRAHDGGQ